MIDQSDSVSAPIFDLFVPRDSARTWAVPLSTHSSGCGTNVDLNASLNKCLKRHPQFSGVGAPFTTSDLASISDPSLSRRYQNSKRRPQCDIELAASLCSLPGDEDPIYTPKSTETPTCPIDLPSGPDDENSDGAARLHLFQQHQRLLLLVPPRVTVDDSFFSRQSSDHRSNVKTLNFAQQIIGQLQYHFLPSKPFFNLRKNRPIKSILSTGKEIIAESLPIRCLEATFVAMYLTQHLASMGVGAPCPMAPDEYLGESHSTAADGAPSNDIIQTSIVPVSHPQLPPHNEPSDTSARMKPPMPKTPKPTSPAAGHTAPQSQNGNFSKNDQKSPPMRFPLAFKSICKGKIYRHIVLVVFCILEFSDDPLCPDGSGKRVPSVSGVATTLNDRDRFFGNFGAVGISRRNTLMDKPCKYPSLVSLVMEYEKQYALIGHRLASVKVGLPISYDKAHAAVVPCWRFLTVKLPLIRPADLPNQASPTPPPNPTHSSPSEYIALLRRDACRRRRSSSRTTSRPPTTTQPEELPEANAGTNAPVPAPVAGALQNSDKISACPTPRAYNTDYPTELLTQSGRTIMCLQGMLAALGNQYFGGDSSDFEPPPIALNTSGANSASPAASPCHAPRPDPPLATKAPLSPSKSPQISKTPTHSEHTCPDAPPEVTTPSCMTSPIAEEEDDDSDTEMNRRRGMCVLYGRSPLHPDGKFAPVSYASLGPNVLSGNGTAWPNAASPQNNGRPGDASRPANFGHKPPTTTAGRLELSARIANASYSAALTAVSKRTKQIKLAQTAAAALHKTTEKSTTQDIAAETEAPQQA